MDTGIRVATRREGEVTVVCLAGSLGSRTAPDVLELLEGLLTADAAVLLDMTGVDYLSSAGLRVLLLAHRRAAAAGARLVLAGLQPEVGMVMAATGFLEFFAVVTTVGEGVQELTAAGPPERVVTT